MDDDSAPMTRVEKLLAALVLAGLVGLVVLMLAWTNGSLSARQPFDAETWRQADGAWFTLHPSERKTMVDDLLNSRLLIAQKTGSRRRGQVLLRASLHRSPREQNLFIHAP